MANGTLAVAPDTSLLWVLRDTLGLTGTKFSCGIAQCGACTVHLDGAPIRSCSTPVAEVMRRERLRTALAMDHHFRIAGFQTLP